MRTTSSASEFVARINKTAANVERMPRVGATAAALLIKNAVLAEIEAIAPSRRLSGVGKKGARVGVNFIAGTNSAGRATVLVRATGPLQLLERDTKAHDIYPRASAARTARGRAAGKRALAGTSFGPVASAHVRGTHGRHPFEKGVERAKPLAAAAMRNALANALAKELS